MEWGFTIVQKQNNSTDCKTVLLTLLKKSFNNTRNNFFYFNEHYSYSVGMQCPPSLHFVST